MKKFVVDRCAVQVQPVWHRFLLAVLCLMFLGTGGARADIPPPTPDKPTVVHVDMWIEDINDINLASGTYDITAQFGMRWHDPRLAYSSDADRPLNWMGTRAEQQLQKIWHPIIDVYGEKGLSEAKVYFLEIWPDGNVELRQKFTARPRFIGELLYFPFGRLKLDLTLASVAMDSNQMKFELGTLSPSGDLDDIDRILHGNWFPEKISWTVTEQKGFAHSERTFPQINLQLDITHDFYDGVQKILLPLFVIALVSWSLLWLDLTFQAAYTSPRIGGTTTLILTTIALKFVLNRELPVVHYFTLSDVLFNTTIIILSISLVASCLMVKYLASDRQEQAKKINLWVNRLYVPIYLTLLLIMINLSVG